MKKYIVSLLLINILLYGSFNQHAGAFGEIPAATLQAAVDSVYNSEITSVPRSPVVRVGIGSANFGTYVYSNITIYGTSDIQVYDNNKFLKSMPAYSNITVKRNFGTYEITFAEGTKLTAQGPVRFTCNSGLLGIKDLKRAGKPALYHGAFELAKYNNDKFNLVNLIEVEDYLKGVVPNEMPVDFGLNALKAQTVAARNYVLSPRVKSSPNYDVVDSVASQVYYGANTEKPLATQAVEETEGVVALYNWNLILAQYSSTAGGYTEDFSLAFSDPNTKEFPSKEKPYLKAKADILTQKPLNNEDAAEEFYKSRPDSFDIRSPYYRWEKDWTAQELHDALQNTLVAQSATGFVKPAFNKGDKLGNLQALNVKRRGDSGKIVELEIVTDTQNYIVQKELVIRRLFVNKGKALPSANVVFECAQDDYGNIVSVKAYGGGYGHGVGLSQFGAGFMGSELKIPYEKILQHYYTGIVLGTKPVTLTQPNQNVTQNFYTTGKETNLVIDNYSSDTTLNCVINGKEVSLDIAGAIFSDKQSKIDISKYIDKGRNTITFIAPEGLQNGKHIKLYVELVKKDDFKYNW